MKEVSNRLNRLAESATLAMARKTRELKEKGLDIIGLSLGEPDFDTPDFIKDAAKEAIDQNYTKYMAVNGYADLREAISQKFKRDNNLDYKASQIVVSTGAKQSIANVVLSLINPGDEVIIRKSKNTLRLIHPIDHSYFNVLRQKLSWGNKLY